MSSPFNSVSRYILFLAKLKGRGRPFLEGARRKKTLWDYPQEHLVVIWYEKVSPFIKFEIMFLLLYFLLEPLTNKPCRVWRSMIHLRIDFRTCQKRRILLSARQGSNNYLELSKENFFFWGGEWVGRLMLSHWPCLTWKFIMIWFHEILKLIFQKQPSCPRVICTEHWRKLPNLTTSKILVEFYLTCIFHHVWKNNFHFVVFTFLENTLNLCIFTHAQIPTPNSVSLKTKGVDKTRIFFIIL